MKDTHHNDNNWYLQNVIYASQHISRDQFYLSKLLLIIIEIFETFDE